MIIVEQDKTYFINYENTASISVAVDDKEEEYAIMATTISKRKIE